MKETNAGAGRQAAALITLVAGLMLALFVVAGEAGAAETTPAKDGRATRDQVMVRARSFLGVPYFSPSPYQCKRELGINCACFTRLVYRKFGISLPDGPGKQYALGEPRTLEQLRKGDLVFFSEDNSGKITHTGIYAGKDETGERMIVHASIYWGETVEKPMKYIEGFAGGRDVLP